MKGCAGSIPDCVVEPVITPGTVAPNPFPNSIIVSLGLAQRDLRVVASPWTSVPQSRVEKGAAQRWSGSSAAQPGLERTFKHDQMKEVCRIVSTGCWKSWSTPQLPVPQELRVIAKSFVGLQEARHQADYSNEKNWTVTEVNAKLADAQKAFQKLEENPWKSCGGRVSTFIDDWQEAGMMCGEVVWKLALNQG